MFRSTLAAITLALLTGVAQAAPLSFSLTAVDANFIPLPGISPFTASTGTDGTPAPWNVGINVSLDGSTFLRSTVNLLVDFDPSPNTAFKILNVGSLVDLAGQDPEFTGEFSGFINMEDLATYLSIALSDPLLVFDPSVLGKYSFELQYAPEGSTDNPSTVAAIEVDVKNANTVPEPGTLALVGLALAGAATLRRRKS